MDIIDLSHIVSSDIPVYPGTEAPTFNAACSIAQDGFLEKKMTLFSHVGTHLDAPAHIIQGAKTLDQFPVDRFFGEACLIKPVLAENKKINLDSLEPFEKLIRESDFVLFHTGWSQYWGKDRYFSGFPVLSVEAASWLTGFSLKGIGVDMISVDENGSEDFTIHKILLEQELIIVENLARLETLDTKRFLFSCFPIKFKEADGSPVRAVAIVHEKMEKE